uniref:RING-type domain-containing protein n=1 Tax=Panagrolaimus sp. ES5 TaxID=591445 RepID=A0AC34GSI2_9BILA
MANIRENFVTNSSKSEESDSTDDAIQSQILKPVIIGKAASGKDNKTTIYLKTNNIPKIIQAATSPSIPAKVAATTKQQNNKFTETYSSSSENDDDDDSDSSDDEVPQIKSVVKNKIIGKPSPQILGTASSTFLKATAKLSTNKIAEASSDDSDDSDKTSSSNDDDEIIATKLKPQAKVINGAAKTATVLKTSKLNNVKTDEASDDTSDTSDSESDKTSSEDDVSEDDASDEEEEDETDDDEPEVIQQKTVAQILKKSAATVLLPQKTAATFNDDETDEDYTSSEDDVFVKKPLTETTQPFETDSDSNSNSENDGPDCSDDSDDKIPIKKIIRSKAVIPPKDTVIVTLPKPPPRVTVPFQNPFPPIKATAKLLSQTPTPIKQPPPQKVQPREDNLLLNALRQFTQNLNNPAERQKELERRAEEALRRNEITFVCCVCMENFNRDANFSKCKKLNGKKTQTEHYICITCLRGTATPENAGIAPDGSGLRCPFPECSNILLMSEIRGMIDAGIESNLLELIGRMSLASADIGILVTARDVDYDHFGGACHLFDNAEEYDQRRLDEVIAKNKNAPI